MKNKLNFKIVGAGPTGLLLSIALSKFDCNIFLTDLLTKDRLIDKDKTCLLYTSPSPRDERLSRMPSSA